MTTTEAGTIAVLNVGAGDLRVTFGDDDVENTKTLDMLDDMLKHGYALLVEIDGRWLRATRIDRKTREYVAQQPRAKGRRGAMPSVRVPLQSSTAKLERGEERGVTIPPTRAPIRHARAVGVARSAGGCAQMSREQLIQNAQRALDARGNAGNA